MKTIGIFSGSRPFDERNPHSPSVCPPPNDSSGFTIVELMIATVIFSVILLTVIYGVLNFTSAYYKGVNASTTQNTTRSIIDSITQDIQFSGATITPTNGPGGTGNNYFCAGNHIYVFQPGVPYAGGSPSAGGLYVAPDNGSCSIAGFGYGNGRELLGKNMRVSVLTVTNEGGQLYTVAIRVAYASGGTSAGNDLLCTPQSKPGSCTNPLVLSNDELAKNDVQCRSQTGSEYCAVSALNASVIRRVSGS